MREGRLMNKNTTLRKFKSYAYLTRLSKRFIRYKAFLYELQHGDKPTFYYRKYYEHVVWQRLNKRWDNYIKEYMNDRPR
jgi:hypothetical protein